MKIIIVGGGIGGLTVAVALQQHGFEAHIYEAAPEIRPMGKGIWLPTNAMLVLGRLSIGEVIAAKGLPLERIELHDKTVGLLQAMDLQGIRQRYGQTTVSILRTDLQAGLVAALPQYTLHLSKRCSSVKQASNSVTVTFDDGTEVEGDIVIGADGIRSVVREAVVPKVALRYSGQTCYLGVADLALPPKMARTVREIWGGQPRFGYSAVGAEKVYWFAPQTAEANSPTPTSVIDSLRTIYSDFPHPVLELINHTPPEEIIRVDLHDFAPIDQWYTERVVLMGDAAHAMTPNLGQGGAQAIEDAYVLAETLHTSKTPETAFQMYTQIRQPKTRKIVTTAWQLGQVAHMANPWLRRARNTAFRWMPKQLQRRQAESLYRLNF